MPSGLSGHQERLNLLRRNLLRYLAPYLTVGGPPLPKILFKFGANHLARGLSPATFGEFYDVGNLAQDLVEAQGQKSLHLMVVGEQGTQAVGANQINQHQNVATCAATADATLKPFFEQTSGPAWNLVDLRPARRALTTSQLQVNSSAMQRILLGYDYLVIIPETTASQTYEFSYKRP